ncbi:hypothetical protein GALL_532700 [mine drainage metagenome]|uniref:Uncharacterized protein n=1 Tax=mine drainage metagenome TaxID=410659 RepID=A0A1J5PNM5_9ZZZZ
MPAYPAAPRSVPPSRQRRLWRPCAAPHSPARRTGPGPPAWSARPPWPPPHGWACQAAAGPPRRSAARYEPAPAVLSAGTVPAPHPTYPSAAAPPPPADAPPPGRAHPAPAASPVRLPRCGAVPEPPSADRTRTLSSDRPSDPQHRSADTIVLEAGLAHRLRVIHVAQIHQHLTPHRFFQLCRRHRPKFIPFGN